jgi:glycosyltransferase involved in cell wall biosynthesis
MTNNTIAISVFTAYFSEHGGGIEKVAEELLSMLCSNDDLSFTWVAFSGEDKISNDKILHYTKAQIKGINIIEKKLGIPFPIPNISSIRNIYRIVKKSNLIHLHDYFYAHHIIAWIIAKLLKKQIVVTQHIGYIPYKSKALRLLLTAANKTIGRLILIKSQRCFFISNAVKSYFKDLLGLKNIPTTWTFLANGVNQNIFKSPENALDLNKSNTLIFVGRLVEKKGIRLVYDLIDALPEYKWIIVGDGPVKSEHLKKPNVEYYPHLNHKELYQKYVQSKLLILPSYGEGFPLVIQEAVSCGVSVLTSRDTAKGCLDSEKFLFTEKLGRIDDCIFWKDKVEHVLRNHELRKEKIKKGLEYASIHWNWYNIANKYLLTYKEITNEN